MAINYDYLNRKRGAQAAQNINSGIATMGNRFDQNIDPNTSEGLYNLALQQGGRSGEVIAEMAHPERSILATAGKRLRELGSGIIDVLETPNEIVAGFINSFKGNGLSVGENIKKAIREDISASDALLGKYDGKNKNFLHKAGNFAVRLGVDILLDPLSYVTFGASRGIMGLSAAPKITAGQKVAGQIAVKPGRAVALAEGAGDDLLAYTRLVAQGAGDDLIAPVKKRLLDAGITDDVLENTVKTEVDELTNLMDLKTVDYDVARKAMTNILEVNPALAEQVLDKGGVKFFGKTILEGQKIRETARAIPYMKEIDKKVEPVRMAIGRAFNPNIQKIGGKVQYVPEEWRVMQKSLKKYTGDKSVEYLQRLQKAFVENGFNTVQEQELAIRNVLLHKQVPSDPKLASLYKQYHELNADSFNAARAAGVPISYLPNRIVHLFDADDIADVDDVVRYSSTWSDSVDAAKQKQNVIFESSTTPGKLVEGKSAEFKGISIEDARKANIPEETIQASIDRQVKSLSDEITKLDELGIKSADTTIHYLKEQIKAVKSGKLDSMFIDPETGEIFTRRAATLPEQLKMQGFEFDVNDADWLDNLEGFSAIESVSRAGVRNINQVANATFVKDMTRFGVPASRAPSHFRELNINKNLTDVTGETMLFDPEIAKNMEQLAGMMSKPKPDTDALLEAYDYALSVWKSSVTSMFPAFHARNGMSNVMLNFADIGYHAMNPKTWGTSATLMNMNRKYNKIMDELLSAEVNNLDKIPEIQSRLESLLSKPIFTDQRTGQVWKFGELQDTLRKKDIAFTDIATAIPFDEARVGKKTFKDSLKGSKSKMEKARKFLPVFRDFHGYEVGREVGSAIENHGRLTNFLTNLQATGDVNLAAARTKQFLFDYSNLTDFEKNWMRRIIPFYSFTKFNLETQVKTLFSTPGKTAAQLKAMDTFTDVLSTDDLTDEQKEMLPSWMKRGFYFLKKQEDGTLKSISVTDSPVQQPIDAFSSKGILGSISPLIRTPLEQLTGYDMYQGKVFSDSTNASAYKWAPKPIKDFIGYDEVTWTDPDTGQKKTWYVSLRPSRLNLMNNLPITSRVIGSLRVVSDDKKSTNEIVNNLLFGVGTRDVDIEKIMEREEKQTLEQYQNVLDTAGVIYNFKRNIISDN